MGYTTDLDAHAAPSWATGGGTLAAVVGQAVRARRERRRRRRPWADLQAVEYFESLRPLQLAALSRQVEWCEVEPGTRLQQRGLLVQRLWIPVLGSLEVRSGPRVLDVVTRPFGYGEIELLLGAPATADVVARDGGLVLGVPAATFDSLLAYQPFAEQAARRTAMVAAARHPVRRRPLEVAPRLVPELCS